MHPPGLLLDYTEMVVSAHWNRAELKGWCHQSKHLPRLGWDRLPQLHYWEVVYVQSDLQGKDPIMLMPGGWWDGVGYVEV